MKNWVQCYSGNWVNLDYVTQIYPFKHEEKFLVLGNIAGQEQAFILSKEMATQEEAEKWVDDFTKYHFLKNS